MPATTPISTGLIIYDRRMLDVMEYMRNVKGTSNQDFLHSISFDWRNISHVKKGLRSFTIQQIMNCIKKHEVNPAFFFHSKALMF